jgi:hypothetical protein
MKVSKSDINILIMVLGVGLAVLSYFVVYSSFTEKKAALEAENVTLQSEVDELQQLADNKQYYLDETARMNDEITATVARFPSNIMAEDIIMYAWNLENTRSIFFNAIATDVSQMVTIATDTAAADATQDAVEGDDAAEGDAVVASGGMKDTVFLYATPITYTFQATYMSMKDIITGIVTSDDRMNLQTLTLSYDGETGCIQGNMTMNVYTMSGTGKNYDLLNVSGVPTGVTDIFKSGTVLNLNSVNSSSDSSDDADSADEDSADEE